MRVIELLPHISLFKIGLTTCEHCTDDVAVFDILFLPEVY